MGMAPPARIKTPGGEWMRSGRLVRTMARRRALLVAFALLLVGYVLAFHVSILGHAEASTSTALPDGTHVETSSALFGWWFYPAFVGGVALLLAGVALVPAHFVARRRVR